MSAANFALAYMRVSGRGQAGDGKDGFERQRLAIQKYADANGFAITEWFQDTQTGKDEWQDRPGWSAMAARVNGCRTIIVEKLDRVARAVLIQELILADLKKREVRLLSSSGDDTDDDSPERQLFRVMLAGFAQYERQSIVLKLRGARQRKKDETGRCEGRKPYGAREGEAAILEVIRSMTGQPAAEISDGLNRRGYKTRYGLDWRPETIRKILARLD